MFDKIKYNLAHFIIRKKYLTKKREPTSFRNIISKSNSFLVIMPDDPKELAESLVLIRFLLDNQKSVSAFVNEGQLYSFSQERMLSTISYKDENKNKLCLPTKNFVNRLKTKSYDIVIDLSRTGDVFLSSAANIVGSKVRIGFEHEKTENYYDIRVVNSRNSPEEIYKNYINFLKMF